MKKILLPAILCLSLTAQAEIPEADRLAAIEMLNSLPAEIENLEITYSDNQGNFFTFERRGGNYASLVEEGFELFEEPADAAILGCRVECITRILGKCVFKMKRCSIGSPKDWMKQAKKDMKKLGESVQREWHNLYRASLPEHIRVILNSNPLTVIGAALGGLQGAALGQAIDQVINRSTERFRYAKDVKEQLPDWKKIILDEGTALATLSDVTIAASGQANKQWYSERIKRYFEEFTECVQDAPEYNDGWDCYNALQLAMNRLVREARRQ